jgi:hypothetical protein
LSPDGLSQVRQDRADTTVPLLAPWPKPLGLPSHLGCVSAVGRVVCPDSATGWSLDLTLRLRRSGPPDRQWGLGLAVGPTSTAAALFLAAKSPERVELTIGGGAVRFPIDAAGVLKDVIEAPSLDVVRGRQSVSATRSNRLRTRARRPRGLCQAYDLGAAESAVRAAP